MHGTDYVVQPLPVSNFAIHPGSRKNTFRLTWQAVDDPLEPTAKAQQYIVYTRLGHGGFDNGTLVRGTEYIFEAEPGLVYRDVYKRQYQHCTEVITLCSAVSHYLSNVSNHIIQ